MKEYKKRILFVGMPDMAFVCLEACYQEGINIVGVMGPKPTHHMYQPFKEFVESKKLNFIPFTDLKSPELINTIKELNVDMAVVCSFNYKIPEILLNAVKDGFINLHPSLLPEYRGSNPYSRVIMNNEHETGVTLHHMSKEFDKGDIILQYRCPIEKDETMGTLFNKTNDICIQLLLSALNEYEKRPLPSIPQIEGDYPKANNIEDSEMFLDYNKPAVELERLVRALNPFILAVTYFRRTLVKVMKCTVVKKHFSSDIPNGTIVKADDNQILIKTAQDCLSLDVMQFGSYFISNAKDFIKFVKPEKGERFY